MARLIDADWLLNAIEKLKVRNTSNTATIFDVLGVLDDVEKIIKAAPINAPVKHGHWIFTGRTYKCSNCCLSEDNAVEADPCDLPMLNFKYCPHCGAKMDGDAND